mmetsp:Transcript_17076/g.55709  ORF Transcript_17076/g.55709 Transcript_17076/m.55709 type:complete len:259 (+) Transcript_17076:510-1286(+)
MRAGEPGSLHLHPGAGLLPVRPGAVPGGNLRRHQARHRPTARAGYRLHAGGGGTRRFFGEQPGSAAKQLEHRPDRRARQRWPAARGPAASTRPAALRRRLAGRRGRPVGGQLQAAPRARRVWRAVRQHPHPGHAAPGARERGGGGSGERRRQPIRPPRRLPHLRHPHRQHLGAPARGRGVGASLLGRVGGAPGVSLVAHRIQRAVAAGGERVDPAELHDGAQHQPHHQPDCQGARPLLPTVHHVRLPDTAAAGRRVRV